ncbi:ABC transporter, ATP-binding protein [Olavius sp. associated proteobacterium Delta 1]|nr:ABC transporter, ATP-binding protein [Olavius sp. associated proteobacterium Delta 1]
MHLKKAVLNPEKYPTRDHYPFNLELFQKSQSITFNSPVTFFVGENGSGKSTLLEAITRKCGIYIWQGMHRPRFNASPYEKGLYKTIGIEWTNGKKVSGSFFGSQIFNNFARILDEWLTMDPGLVEYFGGKSLMAQSHGQSLMAFFKSRLKIKGLYLLDEPETALSPQTQLVLLSLLQEISQTSIAQFIIATHSPILLACPGARILSFDEISIQQIGYHDTNQYRVYKDFMENPEKYL